MEAEHRELDQRRAEEGLVELRGGDEVWYKHIDELTREDRPARIEWRTPGRPGSGNA